MTFGEWCDTTKKEYGDHIPKFLVKEIMVTAIRVALEELLANPSGADLRVDSIGRFYLNREEYDVPHYIRTEESQRVKVWVLRFQAAQRLRDVFNGKLDPKMLRISGSIPLYPEYFKELEKDGKRKRKGRKKMAGSPFDTVKQKSIDRYLEKIANREMIEKEEIIKSKLPEVEEDEQ